MNELKKNQILIEISEDKTKIRVSAGLIHYPVVFNTCPGAIFESIENVLGKFFYKTGLDNFPEWHSTKYCTHNCEECK